MKNYFWNSLLVFIFAIAGHAEVKMGSPAPDFTLVSVDGKTIKLSDFHDKIAVLEWFNPSCPFVQKHYQGGDMPMLQKEFTDKGVVWLTINSTSPKHSNYLFPSQLAQKAEQMGIKSTAVLMDSDGAVGKTYGAKATPHMFVIGSDGELKYQGAIDDNPDPKADPKKAKNYVKEALNELLAGKPVKTAETKQYGCGIKYAN